MKHTVSYSCLIGLMVLTNLFASFYPYSVIIPIAQAQSAVNAKATSDANNPNVNSTYSGADGSGTGGTVTTSNAGQNTTSGSNLSYTPLEPLLGFNGSQSDVGGYISALLKIAVVLGGLAAVASLAFGGITYMVSEVVDKKSAARRRIMAAFFGLVLVVSSWLILNTINPQLVNLNMYFYPTAGLQNSITPSAQGVMLQPSAEQINQCRAKGAGCIPQGNGSCSC